LSYLDLLYISTAGCRAYLPVAWPAVSLVFTHLTCDLDFVDLLIIFTSLAQYFSHLEIRFCEISWALYHIPQRGGFKFNLTPRVLTSFPTTAHLLISYWIVGKF
jgi:hypothetical protein